MPLVQEEIPGGTKRFCHQCFEIHDIDDYHTYTYRGQTRHGGVCKKSTPTIPLDRRDQPVLPYDEVVGRWITGYPIFDQHFPKTMFLFEYELTSDPQCPCTSCVFRTFCWHNSYEVLEGILSMSEDGRKIKVLLRFFGVVNTKEMNLEYSGTEPTVTEIRSSHEFYKTWLKIHLTGCPKKFGPREFSEVPHAFMITSSSLVGRRVPTDLRSSFNFLNDNKN